MTVHIGLLRAINVAGHNKIAMADLCGLLEQIGLNDVRSLLQTGNLVFRSKAQTGTRLELLLETEAAKRLGLKTDFFVRNATEWQNIIKNNPFPKEAERDPGRLLVMFLKKAPDTGQVADLRGVIKGREEIHVKDRHAYIVYPDGIGRSRLTGVLIERCLGTRGTARNWNTILKIAGKSGSDY